jgi:hypothetical protein
MYVGTAEDEAQCSRRALREDVFNNYMHCCFITCIFMPHTHEVIRIFKYLTIKDVTMDSEKSVHQKLLQIIQDEYDNCEWFIISSNELMKTLNDTTTMFQDRSKTYEELKDSIGKIGLGVSNVEKCLDGVEECYNRIVEELANEKNIKV